MENIMPTAIGFQKNSFSVDNRNEGRFAAEAKNKKLDNACKDFEAIMLNKIMSSMRDSLPEGGLFEKSYGEKIFQSMLDEEMTRQMAHGKGIGLAKLLYEELSKKESNLPGGEPQ